MGLGDWLRGLFSGADAEEDSDALYLYLQCSACGEKIRLRISHQAELSRDFHNGGYFVRKVAVGQRCFRPIEVQLRLDDGYRPLSRDIVGGDFLTREQYEATGG